MAFGYQQRVRVPDGRVGYIEARVLTAQGPSSRYLVSFRRQEFSPEEWEKLSPLRGPTVTGEFEEDDLVVESGVAKIINPFRPATHSIDKVIADAERTMRSHGRSGTSLGAGELKRLIDTVTVGSVWVANRGGYFFKVYEVRGDRVHVQGLDNTELRELGIGRFTKMYTRQASTVDELDEATRATFEKKKAQMKPTPQPKSPSVARSTELVQAGTFWASRRNGDIYEVLVVDGDIAKLSWTAGRYTREVSLETVIRHYNPAEKPE